MKLNLSAFENAVGRLQESLDYSHSNMAKQDFKLFQQFRNSVIQCYEFTYEISWKMIERWLSIKLPAPQTKLGFNDLFREAAQYGLIDSPESWFEYRRARNITSHTYNDRLAQEVYEVAETFLIDVHKLLKKLKENNV